MIYYNFSIGLAKNINFHTSILNRRISANHKRYKPIGQNAVDYKQILMGLNYCGGAKLNSNFTTIHDVINFKKWQALQDAISEVTGLAIITVDYRGIGLSEHSKCQAFCKKVRENRIMLEQCQRCDSRGGLEAVRYNKSYIYRCHFDIIDVAVPIIVYDKYVGAIMAGQVRISNREDNKYFEKIVNNEYHDEAKDFLEKHKTFYKNIPLISYEKLQTYIDMIEKLAEYIINESISQKEREEEPLARNILYKSIAEEKRISNNASNLIDGIELSPVIQVSSNSIVKTIYQYINDNKGEQITLSNMAEKTHVSEGYLSRLFKEETGQNFTKFILGLKMGWAKELLEETNISVMEITHELGYNDSGYFIKRFKKREGMTPLSYRKHFSKL